MFDKKLQKGSTVGIVAPSSPLRNKELSIIEKSLKKYGFVPKFGESCYSEYKGYLSGEDKIRAKDIEKMFLDKDIDGIICLRGGYGTPRILDKIDYNIIKENPKFFVGFSDITALHIAFNQKSNLPTIHGIMASTSDVWDEFSFNSLIDVVNMKDILKINNPEKEEILTIVEGSCEGSIIGGNLALIAATMGTEYEIDTKGKILFIEDIGESIYRLDRMLTQLDLGGKFKDCEGIIFGDFADCNKEHENDFELQELIKDIILKYNKPCISNLKSGHCSPMVSIPFGVNCKLDATNKTIEFNL